MKNNKFFKYEHSSIYILFLYFLLLPFEYVFAGSIGSVSRIIAILYIFVVFFEVFIIGKSRLSTNFTVISLLIWIILGLFSYLWIVNDKSYWLFYFPIYTRNALMFLVVTQIKYTKDEYNFLLSGLLLSSLLIGAYIFLVPGSVVFDSYQGRLLIVTSNHYFDPNYLVGTLIGPLALSLNSLFKNWERKRLLRVIFFTLIILLIFWISFLTGSRGGFLGILCVIIASFFFRIRSIKHFIFIVFSFFFIAIIMSYLIELLPEALRARFTIESLTGQIDNGANRLVIWRNAIYLILKHPIFGVGSGNALPAFRENGYLVAVTHNFYLGLLLEYGLIGFSIYISFLLSIVSKIKFKKAQFEIIYFLGIMIVSVFLDTLTTKFFWGMLMILMIYTNSYENKRKFDDRFRRKI